MFRVHLRKKKLKHGQLSLYLDFSRKVYHELKDIWTRRHFLDLYIYERPKTNPQKKHNTAILEIASHKQAEVLLAIKTETYGKRGIGSADKDFLAFFLERANTYDGNTKNTWINAYKHLHAFTKGICRTGDIDKSFLYNFKDHLDAQKLGQNTKRLYSSRLKQAISEAAERGLLELVEIKNFKRTTSSRPFFTDQQVTKLDETPFPRQPVLRRAALFSILTSLRWVDVIALRYDQIQHDTQQGYYIDFKQKKVDRPDILYLGSEALELCGKGTGRIFDLTYSDKRLLGEWFDLAGLKKPKGIAFHIFRHTFAMRALNRGERIEVISSMMGHKDIATTQIYARIYEESKRDAAHRSTLK